MKLYDRFDWMRLIWIRRKREKEKKITNLCLMIKRLTCRKVGLFFVHKRKNKTFIQVLVCVRYYISCGIVVSGSFILFKPKTMQKYLLEFCWRNYFLIWISFLFFLFSFNFFSFFTLFSMFSSNKNKNKISFILSGARV